MYIYAKHRTVLQTGHEYGPIQRVGKAMLLQEYGLLIYITRVGYEKPDTLNEQNVSSLNVLFGLVNEKEEF